MPLLPCTLPIRERVKSESANFIAQPHSHKATRNPIWTSFVRVKGFGLCCSMTPGISKDILCHA